MKFGSAEGVVEMPGPIGLAQVHNEVEEDVAPGELIGLYPYPVANNAVMQLPDEMLEYREPGMLEQQQLGMQEQLAGPEPNDHYTCR